MPTFLRARCTLAGLAALCAIGAAQASPASYLCEGGTTLSGDFSPRAAQLRYQDQKWTLVRARESLEARYADARAGVSLTLSRSVATLSRKGEPPLACKLVTSAIRAEMQESAASPAAH
jgi:hypothetical protein